LDKSALEIRLAEQSDTSLSGLMPPANTAILIRKKPPLDMYAPVLNVSSGKAHMK
jgi:hypothetical protein